MSERSNARAHYTLFESPLGWWGLAWGEQGLTRVQLPEASQDATEQRLVKLGATRSARPPRWVGELARRLVRHAGGAPQDFTDVALDVSEVGPFARGVYEAARRVSAGRTVSYGDIARTLGSPGASRAVGRALGQNPFALIVPCHRVLAASGRPGGFSAYGGVDTKARLLALEGVPLDATPVSPAAAAAGLGFDPEEARRHLGAADRRLAALIERVGPLGLRARPTHSTFRALAEAIIYQQLSGRAAATIVERFRALYPGRAFPSPAEVLSTDETTLRGVGLSGAKAAAICDLARKSIEGIVPPARALGALSDDAIVERLTAVRGIGRWTVEMLLIFRLGRPDVWPVDDYGVRKGFALTFGWAALPTPRELAPSGDRLRPYRSAASWYLWRAVDLENEAAKRAKASPSPVEAKARAGAKAGKAASRATKAARAPKAGKAK
ncbi:MAG: methylated-DNA--[protein]-cysteine S-methyltransferase [Polyangiaceae bacterium]|nr:methylated-DNA--[protein]-cysteine S-methyltransferase [Polyangiaceae bacterium]